MMSLKGINDILPSDYEYHTYVKKVVRHRARQAGFRRIGTPAIESLEVLNQGLGEGSDAAKQLYSFDLGDGNMVALKPEGTIGICRSYIQHKMIDLPQPVLLYYFEPHFRAETPGKGTYRQFWQFGFELLGENDSALDAQVIQLISKIYKDLGIGDKFTLNINTVGTLESRASYIQALQDYYAGKERSLCESCREKLDTNPIRLLDCKEEDCQILAQMAPLGSTYLDKESLDYHEELRGYLDEIGIEYVNNEKLVRGLDYYNKTVFEFRDEQGVAVGAGGRYDGLAEALGGDKVPGVGGAVGVERLISLMKKNKVKVPSKDELHVFVAQLGNEAKKKCLGLIDDLREAGIKTMGALGKGSINIQLGLAHKFKVPYAVLMGLTEVREGTAIIRDMKKGVQETLEIHEVVERIVELIGEENLDKYSPGEILY